MNIIFHTVEYSPEEREAIYHNLDNYTVAGLQKLRQAILHLNSHVNCNHGEPCPFCRSKLLCYDAIAALEAILTYMNDIRKGDHNDAERPL